MSKRKPIPTMLALAAAALVLGTGSAPAQTPIDETRSVSAEAKISVENLSGNIDVRGWDRNEVHITGTLGKGAEELVIEGDDDRLDIRVEIPEGAKKVESSPLDIRVPVGVELEISVVSGDVTVAAITGAIVIDTVSGDIAAEGQPEEIEVSTASGDITLLIECDHVRAEAISGDVELEGVRGSADVETVSGDVHVVGSTFERFHCATVSGDLSFTGGFEPDGSYRFDCHSGDITLRLPADVDADFDVSTFNGEIRNEFGPQARRASKYAPGSELSFSTGSGSASVRVETFSGDVSLEKR